MSNPIILPPLPVPAGTLVPPAMTAGSSWYSHGYTADQLRARDLEVARLVLEAAAQSCEQQAGRIRNLRNTWEQEAAASPLDHAALLIRKMEVRHHE